MLFIGVFTLLVAALGAGIYIGKQNAAEQNKPIKMSSLEMASPEADQNMVDDVKQDTVGDYVSGLIADRIEKTQLWLDAAADDHYSIQLFMARTSDADKVESFLNDVPETLDFSKVYIYETVINGRAWFSVLYDDFGTQDNAINKLDKLPSSLKVSDPYLRRISALKKDIARNR